MLIYAMDDFFHFLQIEKGLSDNTLKSYKRDLTSYAKYINKVAEKKEWDQVSRQEIIGFLYMLKDDGKSSATISRHISSIRAFHQFLIRDQIVKQDVSLHIETPKKERKLPDVLSVEEVESLLAISGGTPLRIRNKAMMEILYATGLRVSELISLKMGDLHLTMGFVQCFGKGAKERIVPLGDQAIKAMEDYLQNARGTLVKRNRDTNILFVNQHGKPLSRQGFWKILKALAKEADRKSVV